MDFFFKIKKDLCKFKLQVLPSSLGGPGAAPAPRRLPLPPPLLQGLVPGQVGPCTSTAHPTLQAGPTPGGEGEGELGGRRRGETCEKGEEELVHCCFLVGAFAVLLNFSGFMHI